MRQSHGQTFDITAESNILGPFLEDGFILSFCATEQISLKRKAPHNTTRD
jgi:hypothetical protein